jgi:hypothetical protein
MKKLCVLALLLGLPAFAKDKSQYKYQDGVLQAVKRVVSGSSCNSNGNTTGTVDANTTPSGQTNGTVNANTQASTTCGNLYQWLYTVKTGDVVYVLTPSRSTGARVGTAVSLGWSSYFLKDSTMANQLPGTQIKLRSDPSGIYVKVGERESLYRVVSAE